MDILRWTVCCVKWGFWSLLWCCCLSLGGLPVQPGEAGLRIIPITQKTPFEGTAMKKYLSQLLTEHFQILIFRLFLEEVNCQVAMLIILRLKLKNHRNHPSAVDRDQDGCA